MSTLEVEKSFDFPFFCLAFHVWVKGGICYEKNEKKFWKGKDYRVGCGLFFAKPEIFEAG